jgi:putative oxidoreductase
MTISRTLARPLLSSIFLVGPIQTLRNSSAAAKKAEPVTGPLVRLAQRAGVPIGHDPEKLVKINAGIQIAAGLALATGRLPRLSAAVLATSLIPTTVAGHDYWNESEPESRAAQRLQIAKNLSLLGGLIIAAGDTDGKPGMAWLAKHAVGDARREAGHLASTARLEGKVAALETGAGASVLGAAVTAAGQHAKQTIQEAAHQIATSETTHHLADKAGELAGAARQQAPVVAATARERLASYAEAAREEAAPVMKDLRKQARRTAKKARKRAPQVAATARGHAASMAETAREQAGPMHEDLRKQGRAAAKDARKAYQKRQKELAKTARKQAKHAKAKVA